MYRVEETYHAEDRDEKYIEFVNILRYFNPLTESVPDLYYVNFIFIMNVYMKLIFILF